jgi:hypothetical protein
MVACRFYSGQVVADAGPEGEGRSAGSPLTPIVLGRRAPADVFRTEAGKLCCFLGGDPVWQGYLLSQEPAKSAQLCCVLWLQLRASKYVAISSLYKDRHL